MPTFLWLVESFTCYAVFPALCFVALYFTFHLRGLQVRGLLSGFRQLLKDESGQAGNVSQFGAIAAVLAGNLGTGNISGTAVALSTGGPGALLWMWVLAFFGAILKYAGCFLGIRYRRQNADGEWVGGPMYYLSEGAQSPWAARLFCFAALASALTVGNLVQVNSMTLPLASMGLPPLAAGLLVAVLVAGILAGGMHRFMSLAQAIVPAMALVYISAAFWVLWAHAGAIPHAIELVVSEAFSLEAGVGGAAGFGMAHALAAGIDRGIFATDAGTGIAPILQAEARTESAHHEGLVAMVAPWVVMVVCSLTGLVVLSSGAHQVQGLQSTSLCIEGFARGLGQWQAQLLIAATLVLFGYTTILAWACCAERALEFLLPGRRWAVHTFACAFVCLIPLGALASISLVWALADVCILTMLLTNLYGLFGLRRELLGD